MNAESTQPYQPRLAGKGRRFMTFLVDYVAVIVLSLVLGVVAGSVWGDAAVAVMEGFQGYLVGAFLYFAYYAVLEGASGRTLGKLVTGTRVVNEQGGEPTFLQVIGRSAARIIPFEPFSVLLPDDARGWHDSLPKTYVIHERAEPAGS